MNEIGVDLRDVAVHLGHRPVISDLSMRIDRSEFLAVVGPSGSGKSTLLRSIAGLQPLTSGTISTDTGVVVGPARERAMVFQDDALLPWRRVRGNVELAVRLQGASRRQGRERADVVLEQVGLSEARHLLPRQLSGGMRQRAQIARTLAGRPPIILMDEPFSSLDAHTRSTLQSLLHDVWRSERPTIVFVTHDIDEALTLGQRVLVLTRAPSHHFIATIPDESERTEREHLRRTIHALLRDGIRY
ncbi:NitT/TauT family transport system ATP-binding protein [Curtobacterium sp. PhB130]|uniref:ABC transporter ATP-binding protein n=1 Tax=Curtobacterium sp. PhB130 TaxID=2485178 RepID=UPI000F921FB4|nr:ABC transporter ATP-binding protein [Curtobacterium sp. PhB130]ROS75881.1 NitT/TauT family transport system ATP-binding protein [Curtobacterium sp. PhB130]